MPTCRQYEVIKQQLKSFEPLGYSATLSVTNMSREGQPCVLISNMKNMYISTSTNWDEISIELAQFYIDLSPKINNVIDIRSRINERNAKNV